MDLDCNFWGSLHFKLKEFADDMFKFDEKGRSFSKWVENTVGKGEIALNEQFLLFSQCFLPFGELSAIFMKFKIVVCKLSEFGKV